MVYDMRNYTNLELRGFEILEYLNEYLYINSCDFDSYKYFEGKTEVLINCENDDNINLTFYIPGNDESLSFSINSHNWEFGCQSDFNNVFSNQLIGE